MTTDAQTAANRANGVCSGGPGPAARERTRFNGVRHGLTATAAAVLPGEDAAAFDAFAARLRGDLAPEGELEDRLVERATLLFWRLARAERTETEIFRREALQEERDAIMDRWIAKTLKVEFPGPGVVEQAEGERMAEIRSALADARLASSFPAHQRGDGPLDRLSRYERGLQRTLDGVLAALERRRRDREAVAARQRTVPDAPGETAA